MSSDWSHEPHALRRCWCGEKAAKEVFLEDWRCRAHLRVEPPTPPPVEAEPPVDLPACPPLTRRAQTWELIRQRPGISIGALGAALGVSPKAAAVFVSELRRESAVTPAGEPLRCLRPPAPQVPRNLPRQPQKCAAEGCKKVVRSELCRTHFEARRYRSGDKWPLLAASEAGRALLEWIEGAGRPLGIKEMCRETGYSYTHISQILIALRRGGLIQPSSSDGLARSLAAPLPLPHCSAPGCERAVEIKGMCDLHYRRSVRQSGWIMGRILRIEDDPAQQGELIRLVIVLDRPADPAIEGQRVRVVTQ